MAGILAELGRLSFDGVIVTDAGSTKGNVVAAARSALGARFPHFIPGHPIAGTEQSGVEASQANLFRGRRVILTPAPGTNAQALGRVRALWEATGGGGKRDVRRGARPYSRGQQPPAAHARLPAYGPVWCDATIIARCSPPSAGGLRDVTRIAASDPVMWRDICLANRTELLAALKQYRDNLGTLVEALERNDAKWLEETFARARRARETLNDK